VQIAGDEDSRTLRQVALIKKEHHGQVCDVKLATASGSGRLGTFTASRITLTDPNPYSSLEKQKLNKIYLKTPVMNEKRTSC
jgi:hypothetical protein